MGRPQMRTDYPASSMAMGLLLGVDQFAALRFHTEVVSFAVFFACLSLRLSLMLFFGAFAASFFGDLSPIAGILLPALSRDSPASYDSGNPVQELIRLPVLSENSSIGQDACGTRLVVFSPLVHTPARRGTEDGEGRRKRDGLGGPAPVKWRWDTSDSPAGLPVTRGHSTM